MEMSYEQEYASLEKTHPWFVARRALILSFLENIPKTSKIIDVGCGSGATISFLKANGFLNVYGIEFSKTFINKQTKPCIANAECLPFRDSFFDAAICADVLEHLQQDSSSAKELLRILKPMGKLIITVPAFNFLWSSHDLINHHFRRYSKKQIAELFKDTHTIKLSYWNFSFFIPTLLLKLIKKKSLTHDFISLPKIIKKIILVALKTENKLIQHTTLPAGTSVVGVFIK